MRAVCVSILCLLGIHGAAAQFLVISGGGPIIRIPRDGPTISLGVGYLGADNASKNVKFKYSGVTPFMSDTPPINFIIVSPSSGTTPALIELAVNPSVVDPNTEFGGSLIVNFTTVDVSPPSSASVEIDLALPRKPNAVVLSVVNSASLQPSISPGAVISILGSNLAAPTLNGAIDDTGFYPTSLGNTTVTFNGIAAPLLFVSVNQINAIVPYALAGQSRADVVVTHYGRSSAAFSVPILDTSPAIFTATPTGNGQAAALQLGSDRNYSYNSVDNPAPRGAVMEFFSTGAGAWNPPVPGDIAFGSARSSLSLFGVILFTAQPVSMTIGGQPAKILYAGTSPFQVWGLLQVNAIVPDGIGSGAQPVVLKVGQNDSSAQHVTIAVK
jgi:uncharacterized protein (TIGR03437 family)